MSPRNGINQGRAKTVTVRYLYFDARLDDDPTQAVVRLQVNAH
jgi:hypothetical protein